MDHPEITVVVCTYNRAEMLRDALESLMCQETGGKFSYEVVVVDDASTDATQQVVREAARKSPILMRYVQAFGKGIGCARNVGIKECSRPWLAFIDDDEVAEPDWLKQLFDCALQTNAQVVGGLVRLKLSEEESRHLLPSCRRLLGETDPGRKLAKCDRETTPGCGNMLLKAAVLDSLGGFDECPVGGGEDVRFAVKVRRAGFEAWYTDKAVVHHQVPRYRLEENFLIWSSLRGGVCLAYRDSEELSLGQIVLLCALKMGRALLITLPLMLKAYISGNSAELIARNCSVSRAWGYLRESICLISPRIFPQKEYRAQLTFRGERKAFAGQPESVRQNDTSNQDSGKTAQSGAAEASLH